jgi:hypothetical protein
MFDRNPFSVLSKADTVLLEGEVIIEGGKYVQDICKEAI